MIKINLKKWIHYRDYGLEKKLPKKCISVRNIKNK